MSAKPRFLFDNRFADATPVASTTATTPAGYAAVNLADWRPYTWWKPTALPATVTVDCGAAKAADYLLIYGHDLFTNGGTVEARGSTDNFVASNVLLASHTPGSNAPFAVSFASASYRYWRLRVVGTTMPAIAIASIGASFDLAYWLNAPFDPRGRKVMGQRNTNENGHPLGRVVDFEKWTQSITVPGVSWSWVRASFEPAWNAHLRSSPFAFQWAPDVYPEDIKLVIAGDDFQTPHQAGSICDLTLELSGVAT